MKTIKNLLMAIAIVAIVMPAFNSCKKGEDDPFLSLQSRKARVTGEWTVDNWKEESNFNSTSSSSGETSTGSGISKTEMNGSSLTIFESGTYSGTWGTYSYTMNGSGSVTSKINFNKDGTFSKNLEYKNVNSTYSSQGVTYTSNYNQSYEVSGTWNFLGGVESDYKNKERIILNILQIKTTNSYTDSEGDSGSESNSESYANGDNSEIWQLTSLRNKEMQIEGEINSSGSYNYTETWGGNVFTSNGTSSESGTIKGTLTQK